jgi:hypothetical protein
MSSRKAQAVTSEGPSAGPAARGGAASGENAPTFDTSVAHVARVYDYWLGGKDNFAADRKAGDQAIAAYPDIVFSVRANRAFLARAVRYLATEAGIRQFLDIGTGIPTANNTHEVAQEAAPSSRVVYVDNDPVVLAHARALLTSTTEGATDYIDADLNDTAQILDGASRTLDFGQPVALMLLGILGHVGDYGEARLIVDRLLAAMPSGSYLVIADGVSLSEAGNEAQRRYNEGSPIPYYLRTPDEVTGFFSGLDLVAPGVVSCSLWRPGPGPAGDPVEVFGGVARKP